MAMELAQVDVNMVKHQGDIEFQLPAGKTLKIKTSPHGEDHLSFTAEAGEEWSVLVFVRLQRNR